MGQARSSRALNLRHIELFVTVVDAGGVTRGANRLGLAQPAVSAALRRLEAEVDARLLTRVGRGAALTAEGEAFLRHARAVLAEVDEARREVATVQALESGHVSLGAPPMVTGHLLPAAVGGFLSEHPGVHLTVQQAGAEECAARVLRGDLDLAIIADWRTPEGLAAQLVENHPMVACVAESSPLASHGQLSWQEFLEQPLILFPKGYHQRSRVDEASERLRLSPTVVVEAEAVPLILELVRRGRGVATLLAAAAEGVAGVHALGLPKDATVPIAVCRRAGTASGSAAEALYWHLVEHLGSATEPPGARPRDPGSRRRRSRR
jgi:DNA-binding transcriptional LysR family regulator